MVSGLQTQSGPPIARIARAHAQQPAAPRQLLLRRPRSRSAFTVQTRHPARPGLVGAAGALLSRGAGLSSLLTSASGLGGLLSFT